MKMKRVAILGSTGSIGINTLKVIERYPRQFKVVALSAFNNVMLLKDQVRRFGPRHVAVEEKGFVLLKKDFSGRRVHLYDAAKDLPVLAALPEVDIVVIGMRGSAALFPFLSAVKAGKTVAPANKEALVIAGDIIMNEARKYQAKIIPVDSEQSAIFQCLEGQNHAEIKKVYLTASGGPLRKIPRERFDRLTVEDILRHPRWKMGKKITVDSATLMNKGFEVIEALRLFDLRVGQVEVVIHPEAVIHSMVGFRDGSVIAQMGVADMRLPIQYALTYPCRLDVGLKLPDFFGLKRMTFEKPDIKKFPALALAYDVAGKGGTFPGVLNAADEVAVDAFLNGYLKFSKIFSVVEGVVSKHRAGPRADLAAILEADAWARETAKRMIVHERIH